LNVFKALDSSLRWNDIRENDLKNISLGSCLRRNDSILVPMLPRGNEKIC